MKMKKIVLLFSLIAVLFSMTGCSDGQEKVDFEYTSTDIIKDTVVQSIQLQNVTEAERAYFANTEDEMAEIYLTAISNFDSAIEECGSFAGYRSKDGEEIDINITAAEEVIANVESKIEESGNTVVVSVTAMHEMRDVVYTFIYEKNPASDYMYELYQQDVSAYRVKEVTVSPNYTFGEKMGKAGANTLMGMGTVFIVLIFISLIIGQFERLAKLITSVSDKIGDFINKIKNRKKKQVTEDVSDEEVVVAPVVSVATNPMEDTQLIAVITAAVVAANTAAGGSDNLVVRSIRKARR